MEVLVDTILELQCLKYWLHFSIHDTSAIHYFLALLLDAAWVRHSMAMWAPAILLLSKYFVSGVPWLTRLQALLFLAVTWLVYVSDVGCYLDELFLANSLLGSPVLFNANQAPGVSPLMEL